MKPVRKSLSPRARETIFDKLGRVCANGCKCDLGYHLDHIIPLENGGEDNESNFQILCIPCHKAKTKEDAKKIAKVRSVRQKHEGHKVPKQSIKSAGFPKVSKPKNRAILPELPRRYFGVIVE